MLIDDFLAFPVQRLDGIGSLRFDPAVGEEFRFLVDDLRRRAGGAECVMLDEPAVTAIANLELNDIPGVIGNFDLARLPHDTLWVEWQNGPRFSAITANGGKGWMPKRTGYLLQRFGGPGQYTAWHFTQKEHASTYLFYPQAIAVDLDKISSIPPDDLKREADRMAEAAKANPEAFSAGPPSGWQGRSQKADAERQAFLRMSSAIRPFIPEAGELFIGWLEDKVKDKDPTAAKVLQQMHSEMMSDFRFLIATLLAINTGNFFELGEGPDLLRPNASRKKHGKPRLMEHRILRVHPSRIQARLGNGSGSPLEHHCRGHLKRRIGEDGQPKLFWWSQHWRTNPKRSFFLKP